MELPRLCYKTLDINLQVNDVNLAEIEGGEVATTNLHSCNGPDFVVQLRFHQDTSPAKSPSKL